WRVFLVALRSMKLTVVPRGNVIEIVEDSVAVKDKPLPLYTEGRPGATDELVRVVLRPDNLSPDDLFQVLNELKSVNGVVNAVPRAGLDMLIDEASNGGWMAALMLAVDQEVSSERLYLLRVKYVEASEMVTTLTEVLVIKDNRSSTPAPA